MLSPYIQPLMNVKLSWSHTKASKYILLILLPVNFTVIVNLSVVFNLYATCSLFEYWIPHTLIASIDFLVTLNKLFLVTDLSHR